MRIVYLSDIDIGIPNNANSVHVANMAVLLHKAGHDVSAICEFPKNGIVLPDTGYIRYKYMKPIPGKGKIRGLLWIINSVTGIYSSIEAKKLLEILKPDYVIIHEANSMFFVNNIRKWGKIIGYKSVIETTEWMESGKERSLSYNCIVKQKDYSRRKIDKKCGNIIAISKYLEEHYINQNCYVVRIPPLFSEIIEKEKITRFTENRCNSRIKLVFAGTLSSKDYLEPLLKTLLHINRNEIHISFDVIGPNKYDIEKRMGEKNLEKYGIYCHGRISHDDVLALVKQCDFSVLLRNNQRYAKAGVSTKFCEAMCLGVPSICTEVGGTDRFVVDENNGFLIPDNKVETIINVLNRILQLDSGSIILMKRNACETAINNFAVDKYIDPINDFLKNCN